IWPAVPSLSRSRIPEVRRIAGRMPERDNEFEGRTRPGLACHFNSATKQFRQSPRNSQSESGAATLACTAAVNLREFFEYAGQSIAGYADARVRDADVDVAVDGLRLDLDAALLRKFGGVAQQIHDDLPQFVLVRKQGWYCRRDILFNGDAAAVREGLD